jgi:hypothetical protein
MRHTEAITLEPMKSQRLFQLLSRTCPAAQTSEFAKAFCFFSSEK